MASQRILWTALPNGLIDVSGEKRMRVSVLVSPRLEPQQDPPKLGSFPDFLHWAAVARQMTFAVEFQSGPVIAPDQIVRIGSDPDQALYSQIFGSDVHVQSHAFKNYRSRLFRSYPVRNVASHIRQIYRTLAENDGANLPNLPFAEQPHPVLADLANELGAIEGRGREEMDIAVTSAMKEPGAVHALDPRSPQMNEPNPLGFQSGRQLDFFQLDRFYNRPESQEDYRRKPDVSEAPPPLPPPEVDFHQMVAALSDYPALMRRLGFVIDLSLPLVNIPSTGIRVIPQRQSPPPQPDLTPYTKYILTQGLFTAASKTSEIQNGMLNIANVDDSLGPVSAVPYDLIQVDTDGAGIKALGFATNMQGMATRANSSPKRLSRSFPREGGLPSLRSAGIGLVRLGRAHQAAQRVENVSVYNANLMANPHNRPVLFAEDVLRGYRVDIMDETVAPGQWRSLCWRDGRYELPDGSLIGVHPDEGYIKLGSAASGDAAASDFYFHEAVFRWSGWSLVAPLPGRTIRAHREPDSLHQDEIAEFRRNEPVRGINLNVNFTPLPGTLPKLRFGHSYRMRARTVDLAGNSLRPEAAGNGQMSNSIVYSRFEPVDAPVVVPRARFCEGESQEVLVIRSNHDMNTADYVASAPVQEALQNKKHVYSPVNDRHMVPPHTSQLMAEMHGMFDGSIGRGTDAATRDTFYLIATKEAGTLADTEIVNIGDPGKPIPVPGVEVIESDAPPPADPDQAVEGQGSYVIHREDNLPLPYLPDPVARGVALRGVPGVDGAMPLGGDVAAVWAYPGMPVVKVPFKLQWPFALPFRIAIRERSESMAPEGCDQTFLDSGKPVWDTAKRELTVFLAKGQVARVRYNSYLDKDDLKAMGLWRWLQGSQKLPLFEMLAAAGAHWMVEPYRELTLVHAVQQPLCRPSVQALTASRVMGDTFVNLRGSITLSACSTGKIDILAGWREPLDELADPGPKVVESKGRAGEFSISDASMNLQEIPWMKHEFGDTKHRIVQYRPLGATRFREYFPPEITEIPENISREGDDYELNILSSARPAAPRILYVLPAFEWNRTASGETYTSARSGNALRVYMERPWFSSGGGELLGVLLRQPNQSVPAGKDPLKPFVTQWGKDPVYESANPKSAPQVSDFPMAVKSESGRTIGEVAGTTVSVAGHEVFYDESRQLWYSDIAVSAGNSYCPFVRLALARYQPDSIPDAHLSAVVLADFIQLAPDRNVVVTFSADRTSLNLQVFGFVPTETGVSKAYKTDPVPAPPGPDPNDGLNSVTVSAEFRAANAPSDLDWAPTSNVTIQLLRRPIILDPNEPRCLWNGNITLPAPAGSGEYRVVIREFEKFFRDAHGKYLGKETATRLTYAEVIEL